MKPLIQKVLKVLVYLSFKVGAIQTPVCLRTKRWEQHNLPEIVIYVDKIWWKKVILKKQLFLIFFYKKSLLSTLMIYQMFCFIVMQLICRQHNHLNIDLKPLFKWRCANKISLNVSKTEVLLFVIPIKLLLVLGLNSMVKSNPSASLLNTWEFNLMIIFLGDFTLSPLL